MIGSFVRLAASAAALAFVAIAAPSARGSEMACGACNYTVFECQTYTLYALTGCCGMGDGNAQCYTHQGGMFAVACESGKNCTCDEFGEDCEPLEEG
jgi:hypothetical protein